MHFTSRRARVATLIAAGIIGFGGVAAAGAADQPIDLEKFSAAIGEPDGDTSGEEATEESSEDATTEQATDDGATDDGATDDGATVDGATDDGATDDGATDDGATEDESGEGSTEEGAEVEATEEGEEEAPTPEEIFVNEAGCVTDAEGNELNHGKTVSAVARGLIPDAGWASVSAAAQSDCGKKHKDEDGTSVEENKRQ